MQCTSEGESFFSFTAKYFLSTMQNRLISLPKKSFVCAQRCWSHTHSPTFPLLHHQQSKAANATSKLTFQQPASFQSLLADCSRTAWQQTHRRLRVIAQESVTHETLNKIFTNQLLSCLPSDRYFQSEKNVIAFRKAPQYALDIVVTSIDTDTSGVLLPLQKSSQKKHFDRSDKFSLVVVYDAQTQRETAVRFGWLHRGEWQRLSGSANTAHVSAAVCRAKLKSLWSSDTAITSTVQ